jgi:class 3 adenylate cyclase
MKCGFGNASGAKVCGECGTWLTPKTSDAISLKAEVSAAEAVRVVADGSASVLEGERKTVTTLFADIKGSMELIEDLDPEEARALVDPALKLMIDAVHHYEGYVAQSTGDGVFALFGAPVAHEDHPQRALHAALRMQEAVKRYAEKLRAEKGVNLQVRVGANTGEVVVREIQTEEKHTEYAPIGHSTGVAARLQGLAAPGSIAISEPVRKLVEGYFAMKPLGPARIKGVSEPLQIYEVTGLGPVRTRLQRAAARGYTKFVGRQREMDAMKHAAEVVDEVVENIDLCPTFAELAGVAVPATADGRSLVPLLRGEEVPDWRTLALIEHHGPLAQADEQEDPDLPGARSGDPPTYAAVRSPSSVYVEYGDGTREYHDHVTDPYELQNTFVSLAPDKKASLHAALVALQACHGTENCWQSARLGTRIKN